MNTGYCPETSKDANGYNRYYRIKVLLNVAEYVTSLRYTVLKLYEGEGQILYYDTQGPSIFRRSFHVVHYLI